MGNSDPDRCKAVALRIFSFLLLCFVVPIAIRAQNSTAKHPPNAPLQWANEPQGANRCILCHRAEVEGYSKFAMAHSLRKAGNEPIGSVSTADTKITISDHQDGYWQRLESNGSTTNYRIDYVIGSGNHASGYLLDLANHLFQSPVAYYKTRHAYDLAPGYEGLPNPDFTRPVTEACLFCHSGTALPVAGTRNKYHSPAFSAETITCERCHGPVEKHLADPRKGTIINPAKLEPVARDSICEQCHLLGVGRVLNPGKKFSDFVPGEPLEDVFTTYHLVLPPGSDSGKFKVISQVEQLARSTCSRMSAGRMWCGTCHNPHDKPVDAVAYFRNKCLSCHTGAFSPSHPDKNSNCIGCHMPRRNAKDGGHTVFTDHRIERRPSVEQPLPENVDIAAWREPASEFRKRNLGISYINYGAERRSPEFVVRGYRLLTQVQQQFANDDALFTAIGTALLLGKQAHEAEFAFDRALQLNPNSVSGETNDASAYLQAGDVDEAIAHLERAVTLDPLDLTAVAPLIDLYKQKGNLSRANELSAKIAVALDEQSAPAAHTEQISKSPAEKTYKNIQVLTGIPSDQLIPAMRFIAQSLGVNCSYCHVPNHFDDDFKRTKQTSRKMMRMMNSINAGNFDEVRAVTCYSCHRGAPKPQSIPEIAGNLHSQPALAPVAETSIANLPTADEIIDRYIQAVGGAAAIDAVASREEQGTLTSGEKITPIEIFDEFPDRHVFIRHAADKQDFTIINGSAGWFGSAGHSLHDLQSSEIDATKLTTNLHLPTEIIGLFAELHREYPENVDDREVYVLSGRTPGHPEAKFYFDEKTGFLIRILQFVDSPLGQATVETHYDDYRVVDGVKVPFRWTIVEGSQNSNIQLEKVQQNIAIDEEHFEKPKL